MRRLLLLPTVLLFAACSSSSSPASGPTDSDVNGEAGLGTSHDAADDAPSNDGAAETATTTDTGTDTFDAISKAGACTSTFGSALPSGFLRLDGTVVAVIPPNDQACAMPNSTHLILELSIAGDVYRVVANVQSDVAGNPNVYFESHDAPLPAPAFAEGSHEGLAFDYVTTLGVHSTDADWASVSIDAATEKLVDTIDVGAHVSVYASGTGGTSVHLVHRNATNQDGALVLDPEGSPRFLLFHFDEQTF